MKLWIKAKAMIVYNKVQDSFKFNCRKGRRFHEFNWMTINDKQYYNKGKLIGKEECLFAV